MKNATEISIKAKNSLITLQEKWQSQFVNWENYFDSTVTEAANLGRTGVQIRISEEQGHFNNLEKVKYFMSRIRLAGYSVTHDMIGCGNNILYVTWIKK